MSVVPSPCARLHMNARPSEAVLGILPASLPVPFVKEDGETVVGGKGVGGPSA